jgi:hypothetical protein
MLNSKCNKSGISMIEVLIALSLISVGVMALITLLPSGWRLSGKSDLLGRAAAILHAELEKNEILIVNEKNSITPTVPGSPETKTVYGSGKATPEAGDAPYTVQTERMDLGGSWRVRIKVTWPANATGISGGLIVARQRFFAQ